MTKGIRPCAALEEIEIIDPARRHALALMLCASSWARAASAGDTGLRVRFCISESLVGDVNVNDARAALRVWIARVSRDLNLGVETNPNIFETRHEILDRVRKGTVDCVAINVLEYRSMAELLDSSHIVAQDSSAPPQYVILVKQGAAAQSLADLRGRRLIMLNTPQTCVAPAWLSWLLRQIKLDEVDRFFGAVTRESKASRVILPVFFGQADACLTTSQSLKTMSELNPQVGKQLRPLATSSEIVATFYAFRKAYRGPMRDKLVTVLSGLRASPSGQQLMTLFQFDGLVLRSTDCLKGALSVLESEERARLRR